MNLQILGRYEVENTRKYFSEFFNCKKRKISN